MRNDIEDIVKKQIKKLNKSIYNRKYRTRSIHLFAHSNKNYRKSTKTIMKIIAHRKTQKSAFVQLDYLIKNNRAIAYDDVLNPITAKNYKALILSWNLNPKEDYKGRQITTGIFSLPSTVANTPKNVDKLNNAVSQTLLELYPNNKFFLATHKDTNNLHCHFTIKCSENGGDKKLQIGKKDMLIMHATFDNNAKKMGLDIERKNIEKDLETLQKKEEEKKKSPNVYKYKMGKLYQEKAKNWVDLMQNNKIPKMDNDEKLKSVVLKESFESIYKDNWQIALSSFVMLYKEDKTLAMWSLKNNQKVFISNQNIKQPELTINLENTLNTKDIKAEMERHSKSDLEEIIATDIPRDR
jgi:hypothetical protein